MTLTLEIDVAKAKLDVALRLPDGRIRSKVVANTDAGFVELQAWLARQSGIGAHVGLEATGTYWEAVAAALAEAGYPVSVVNPARIKAYGAARQVRTQTLAEHWDGQYPSLSPLWLQHWEHVITVFDDPEDIRRAIYTTHALESLNSVIRKAINNRRIFPSDRSALKVVYLAIEQAARKWTMPIQDWKRALNRFAILFEGRLPL
jgi:hypothetical protein